MRDEKAIRQEIFEKIKELHNVREQMQREFIPGVTPIPYAGRVFDEDEIVTLVDSSLDFWLTSGRYAEKFECDLAEFLQVRHCILTNSGSSANLLAISALTSPKLGEERLKPGDEVITTACGFPTTLNPIIQNNLVPVFIDIELGTYNIRVDQIQDAISNKTKALVVPHTLGNPANLKAIMDLVDDHRLWFIEDNCDALGSKFNGKYTGSFGHLSTCSFYPAHHITMGEGGAVLTNDLLLKKIVSSFRDWGRDCWCDPGCDNSCGKRFNWQSGDLPYGYDHKYIYSHIGYNLKVTDMQAAIGCAQLEKLQCFIERRQENFNKLFIALNGYSDLLVLPKTLPESQPSWFGFPMTIKDSAPFSRADIISYLEDHKIATRMLFGGNLLKQPAYKEIRSRTVGSLDATDEVMQKMFWVGVYPGITDDMLSYMIEVFHRFFIKYKI